MKKYKIRIMAFFLLCIMLFSLVPTQTIKAVERKVTTQLERVPTKALVDTQVKNNLYPNINNLIPNSLNKYMSRNNTNKGIDAKNVEENVSKPVANGLDKDLSNKPLENKVDLNIDNSTLEVSNKNESKAVGSKEKILVQINEEKIKKSTADVVDKATKNIELENNESSGNNNSAPELLNENKSKNVTNREETIQTSEEKTTMVTSDVANKNLTKVPLEKSGDLKLTKAAPRMLYQSEPEIITKMDDITLATNYGKVPNLPSKASVKINDKKWIYTSIEWNSWAQMESTYATAQENITISGVLVDYGNKYIEAKVRINPKFDSLKKDIYYSTPKGVVPDLSSYVEILLSNGRSYNINVIWEDSAKVASTYNTSQKSVTIQGKLWGSYQGVVTATVNILNVTSVSDINLTTNYGVVPSLPSYVNVTLSDGTKRNAPIEWNQGAKSVEYYKTNSKTIIVNGKLIGYGDIPITANVEVVNVIAIEDKTISTPVGIVPSLSRIKGTLSNGKTEDLEVIWDKTATIASTYNTNASSITISGTLVRYDKRIINVTVNLLSVSRIYEIKFDIRYGDNPNLPSMVNVVLSDGSIRTASIAWGDEAKKKETYAIKEEEVEIKGKLIAYGEKEVRAKVKIINIIKIEPIKFSTPQGCVPSLPSSAWVTCNNANSFGIGIRWDKVATLVSTYDTSESEVIIKGKIIGYDEREITAVVKILTVSSISEAKYKTPYGVVLSLPSSVCVKLNNGNDTYAPVQWEESTKRIETYKTKEPTITIRGTLIGYGNKPVSATVDIQTIKSVDEIKYTTPYGVIPKLYYVTGTLSDGKRTSLPVIWEQSGFIVSTYITNNTVVEVKGKITEYDGKDVVAKVTIQNISTIDPINISTPIGCAPTLPSVWATLNTGEHEAVGITWEKSASLAATYNTDASEVFIKGRLEKYDKREITVPVKVLKVSSINEIRLKTPYGVVPSLPTSVRVKLSNGTEADAPIQWEGSAKATATYMTKEPTIIIKGTLVGYGNRTISPTIDIQTISSVDEIKYTTNYGEIPRLGYVIATLSDGIRISLPVSWEQAASLVSTYTTSESTVAIKGNITAYGGKEFRAKVDIVNIKSVNPVKISTPYGILPQLSNMVSVTLNNGQTVSVYVVWEQAAGLVATYKTDSPIVTIKGKISSYDKRDITAEINVLAVKSIGEIKYTTPYGVVPSIQDYVDITLSNGNIVKAPIVWEKAAKTTATYETKEPSVMIQGTLVGYGEKKITGTVTVQTISIVDEINFSTQYGIVPKLTPIKITLSDGTKNNSVPVIWEQSASIAATYITKEPYVTIKGKIVAYGGKEVTAKVTVVNVGSMKDIKVSTPHGIVPKLPDYIDVALTDGKLDRCAIVWDKSATLVTTYKTDSPTVIIKGKISGFDNREIAATIIILTVDKVNNINISTQYGVVPNLPASVPVTLSDGNTAVAPVVWDSSAREVATYTTTEPNVTIKGTLVGFGDKAITSKINVQTVNSLIDDNITTTYGVAPTLPSNIYVILSDGSKVKVPVVWEKSASLPVTYSTKEPLITIKGKVVGYGGKEINAKVTVLNVNSVTPINIITPVGIVPKLPTSVVVTLNSGINVSVPVSWEQSAGLSSTYKANATTVTINGILNGYDKRTISATVTIISVDSINYGDISTPYGEVPKLPSVVKVNLNNGTTEDVQIVWEPSAKDKSTYTTSESSIKIKGKLVGYGEKELVVKVNVLTVKSVKELQMSTKYGVKPSLSSSVNAELSDGTQRSIPVIWDQTALESSTYVTDNLFVAVKGVCVGYGNKEVYAKIDILNVNPIEPIVVSTPKGHVADLPGRIHTMLNNGTMVWVDINWDSSAKNPSIYNTDKQTITVKGKISDYDKREITAIVNILTISSINYKNISTPYGVVPKLPNTINVTLNTGSSIDVPVKWEQSVSKVETYTTLEPIVTIKGVLENYGDVTTKVNVQTVKANGEITLTTKYASVPELPNAINCSLSDGTQSLVQVSWDNTAKLAQTYVTNEPIVTIRGKLIGYGNKDITAKVSVINIESINPLNISTSKGVVPNLPDKVAAYTSDGKQVFVGVNWQKQSNLVETYNTDASTVTIKGTLVDYDKRNIDVIVTVLSVNDVNYGNIATPYGVVPSLPDSLNVTLNNGATANAPVVWEKSAKEASTYTTKEPTVTIKGTLVGYGGKIANIKVNIQTIALIDTINISTKYGVVPTFTNADVTLNDGTKKTLPVEWEKSAYLSSKYCTDEQNVIINGSVIGYGNKAVTANINVINVKGIYPVNISTPKGVVPTLPSFVKAMLNNGDTATLEVVWDEVAKLKDTYRTDEETVTLNGKIIDYDKRSTTGIVKILKVDSVDDISLKTKYGVVPNLPENVSVTLSDGRKTNLQVVWDKVALLPETYATDSKEVTIKGTVAGYGDKVITAIVSVNPKVVLPVNNMKISTDYGVKPKLPQKVDVILSDGQKKSTPVIWDEPANLDSTYATKAKTINISGTLPEINNEKITVTINVNPIVGVKVSDVSIKSGEIPNLPDTVSVTLSDGSIVNSKVVWEERAKLKETYNTNELRVAIKGTLPEYDDKEIILTVNVNTVSDVTLIDSIKISTIKGIVPDLPDFVDVLLSDGTKHNTKVIWDDLSRLEDTYNTTNTTVKIKGVLSEYENKPVAITVDIKPSVDSVDDIKLSTEHGVVPKLPEEVGVVLSDGTATKAKITWNDIAKLKDTYSKDETTVTIEGTLKDYGNKKVIAKVIFKVINEDINEQLHYGEEGVNSASGNLSRNYTDMILNPSNTNINVTRTYNGKDTRKDSPLGKGWTFGFEGWIKNYKDKDLMKVIKLPNGSIVTFNDNSDGTFSANDSRNTLTYSPNGTYILKAKDQTSYGFNPKGYLIWMKDRYGNSTDIDVDSNGRVIGAKDAGGRRVTVSYNGQGFIGKVTDGTGRNVIYNYTNNLLTSVLDPTSKTINYRYNDGGVLIEISDSNKNLIESIVYYEEDGENKSKVSSITDKFGNIRKYTYDNTNKSTTITDSNNKVTVDYTDDSMYTIKSLDPENRATTTIYNVDSNGKNSFGEQKSVTNRNGNTVKYERDDNGNIISQINPDNSTKTFGYDRKNNKIKEVDEIGNKTFYIYDESGIYLLKKVEPLNGVDEYNSDANQDKFAITSYIYYLEDEDLGHKVKGLLKQVIDPNGNSTSYTYDENGNVKTSTDGEGNKTTYEYDKNGWKTSVISPNGNKTKYVYDNDGNIMLTTLNGGETTRVVRDIERRKIKEVSANLYNPSSDSTKSDIYSDDVGNRYVYNADGTLQSVKDAENNVTRYAYDIYGNVISETRPDGAVYSQEYDVMNRVIHTYYQENPSSKKILLSDCNYVILDDGKTQKQQTKYINSNETAVTTLIYDYANRLVEQDNPDGTKLVNNYNPNGTIASTTDVDGNTTNYRYDGLNRPTEKWTPLEKSDGKIVYSYSRIDYDKGGRKIAGVIGKDKVYLDDVPANVITASYSYYDNNKLKSERSSSGKRKDYSYDKDGAISKTVDYVDLNNQEVAEYENNHLGKPVSKIVHVRKGDIYGNNSSDDSDVTIKTEYSYDKNGNVKTITTADGMTTTYGYDNLNRQNSVSQPGVDENGQNITINTSSNLNYEGKVISTTDGNNNTTTCLYDGRGNLIRKIDAKGKITAYYYDNANRKVAEVLPKAYSNGKDLTEMDRTEYEYDTMGKLITVKSIYFDASINGIKSIVNKAYAYDKNGNVIKELDANGYQSGTGSNASEIISSGYGIETTYNLANKPVTIKDAETKDRDISHTVSFSYDGAGRKVSEINASGVIINYYYDDAGNLLRTAIKENSNAPEVTVKTSNYDFLGNIRSTVDGNGNKTYYDYTSFNKVRSMTYPGDNTIEPYKVSYQYDVLGNLKQSIDSSGKANIYDYDNQGRVTLATEQALDGSNKITTSASYDKNGNKRFVTDGNGNVIENTYDELNRLISTSTTVNSVKKKNTYDYDANNNKISETDWLGNTTRYDYDGLNRVVEKIDANGKTIEKLQYYDNGAQSSKCDALGNETKYFYDKNKRLIKIIDPEKHETKQSYDSVGNIASKTDGNNNETKYFYNQYNNLVKVTNANNESTTYTYDLNGNKLSQTDGLCNTTIYEYNVANKITRKIDNGGRVDNQGTYSYNKDKVESYTYNPSGNIQSKTDRNGLVTKYVYDIHGRKTSENVGSINIGYTYDNNGNQLTISDATGTTVRTYDALNRVVSKRVPDIGESKYNYDITEGMDEGTYGEKTIDPKGNVTLKVYDKIGRLSKGIEGGKTTTYSYYDNGSLKSVIYPDGSGEYYTYKGDNSCSNLVNKKADGSIIDSYVYTYDGAKNMLSKVDGKGKTTYSYDKLNRLKTTTNPDGIGITYDYDAAGNRLLETVNNGVETSYKYNDQNRLISTTIKTNGVIAKTVEYTYDNNGNQLTSSNGSSQITKNSYDEFNELIKTTTPDGKTIINVYNGEGKRVAKISDGVVRRYLYEGEKVILETDGNGVVIGRNIYGTNLVSRIAGGVKGYYLYNGHGDVTCIIGEDGKILATYYYDEFGNIKSSTGNFDNQYGYAGYQYDKETGTYYLMDRMYDPETARFLQEDTYRGDPNDPLSLNLYTYCNNNPLIYDDPTGHWPELLKNVLAKGGELIANAVEQFGKAIVDTGNKIEDATVQFGKVLSNIGEQMVDTAASGAKKAKEAYNWVDDAVNNSGKYYDEMNKDLGIDNRGVRTAEGVITGAGKFAWGVANGIGFIAGSAVDIVKATGSAIGNNLGFISDDTYRECISSLKGDLSQISKIPGAIVDSAINTVVNVPRIFTDSNMSVEEISNTTSDTLNTVFLAESIGKGLSKSTSVIKNTALSLDDSFSLKTPTSRVLDGINDISNREPLLNDIQLLANKGATKPDFIAAPGGVIYKADDYASMVVKEGEGINTLYHYTNDKGLNGILESGKLNPSIKALNPKDARYTNGQYLSDVVPGENTLGQLSYKFLRTPWGGKRFTNYLEIDVRGLNIIKGRDGVYAIPNEGPLDISNRIINYGKSTK